MHPNFQIQLLRSLCGAPLLVHDGYLTSLTALLLNQAGAIQPEARANSAAQGSLKPWEAWEAMSVTPGGTAIVPMRGMLYAGLDQITAWYFGLCRPEALQANLEAAADDRKIKAVVLESDTPGGVTTQIPETGEAIAEFRANKFIATHVSGMCCSAGYWLASQTHHIDAAGSSDVGCVGTYAAYYDMTRMLEMRGIDLELFKAGKYKAMGIPGKPLTDEERAFIQEDIDRLNARFVGTVQAARPQIAREDLEGQVFDGDSAYAKGFTDSKSRNLTTMIRQMESRR
jgi:signal peptide peptidase SppA